MGNERVPLPYTMWLAVDSNNTLTHIKTQQREVFHRLMMNYAYRNARHTNSNNTKPRRVLQKVSYEQKKWREEKKQTRRRRRKKNNVTKTTSKRNITKMNIHTFNYYGNCFLLFQLNVFLCVRCFLFLLSNQSSRDSLSLFPPNCCSTENKVFFTQTVAISLVGDQTTHTHTWLTSNWDQTLYRNNPT